MSVARMRRGTGLLFAWFLRLADEDPAAAGRVAVPLAAIGAGDRDLVERRRDAGVPVHVVVGLVRLALGLQQRGWVLQERHAELVRAGRHPDAGLQVLRRRSDGRRSFLGGVTVNDAIRSRSSSTSSSCGSRRPSTCSLRSRARRSWISYSPSCGKVYGISAPPRVPSGRPSTCSSWVRSGRMRIVSPPGERPGTADGQPADLLRRGDVAVQERRREVAHRHVVEPVAGLVRRQQRRGVDVERQQVADRVLVLGPVEPAEGVGPAGLGACSAARSSDPAIIDTNLSYVRLVGLISPAGGICLADMRRTTFSQTLGC